MEQEIWKVIESYPMYEVSNLGKVRKISSGRVLKQCLDSKGYPSVNVNDGKKATLKVVHRLVAFAFIPNPNNYPEVDHIDRDGLNNHVSNLRWCNRSLNMQNENTRRVMSISQSQKRLPTLHKPVVQIKDGKVVDVFESITDAGRNGYTVSCVIRACKHQIHTHKGYCWEYLSEYNPLAYQ